MYSALFDASVLHPWALCHLELLLAEAGFYRPVWTAGSSRDARPAFLKAALDLDEARVSQADGRRCACIRGRGSRGRNDCRDAYWAAVPGSVPEHDRHVVAAALAGRADVLVTANLRHFPADDLGVVGLLVQSPDDFLIDQWYLNAPAWRKSWFGWL